MKNDMRLGHTVRTPLGRRARIVGWLEDGYRARLEYVPDEPPEFGERPDEVVLPVKLLKADARR